MNISEPDSFLAKIKQSGGSKVVRIPKRIMQYTGYQLEDDVRVLIRKV